MGGDQPLDPVLVECRVVHDSPELERRLVGATEGGPRVQRWPEESQERLVLRTAELDNIDFLGPNQLLAQTLVLAGWTTSDELLLITVKILPTPED